MGAELNPMSPITHMRVAYATWHVGRTEEALALVRRNIERNPEFPLNYWQMYSFQHRLGHLGEAQRWLHEARRRNPGSGNMWASECDGYLHLGDLRSAENCARELGEAHPDNFRTKLQKVNLHRYRGEWQEGIAMLESMGGHYRRAVQADWVAGQGDIERARRIMAETFPPLFEDEVELVAGHLRYAIVLAAILNTRGEVQQRDVLLAAVEERVATLTGGPGSGYVLADMYISTLRGDHDRAIAVLREVIDRGWRAPPLDLLDGPWWAFRHDWKLKPLHQNPEFIAIMDELEADIAAQRQWYEENRDKPLF
jgi:tetratricopeptide (TPR) repeat protein